MTRKTRDPALIALMDEQERTFQDVERWYSRLKRAFTRMDKLKKKLVRIAKKIADHENPSTPEKP